MSHDTRYSVSVSSRAMVKGQRTVWLYVQGLGAPVCLGRSFGSERVAQRYAHRVREALKVLICKEPAR